MINSLPILVTIFYGLLYSMMQPAEFGFTKMIDPYYFSFTTMSTVGYGDFSPKSNRAKLLVMSQQVVLVIGVLTLVEYFIRLK
jgi:hypothetical protein